MDAFRLTLADHERLPTLLAVSGSLASCVLVEMVYGVVKRTHGAYAMPGCLHVKLDGFKPISQARQRRLIWLKETFSEMNWVEVSLEKLDSLAADHIAFAPDASDGTPRRITDLEGETSIRESLSMLGSQTAQEDLLSLYTDALLFLEAKQQGAGCLQFADTATKTAAKVLTHTALGRGYALPFQVADWNMRDGIWAVRPMKQLLGEELSVYASLVGVPAETDAPSTDSKAGSIGILTQRYFKTLEKDFPSLVATVVRTTGKLVSPDTGETSQSGRCPVCAMPFKIGARGWLQDVTANVPAPMEVEAVSAAPEAQVENEDLCYGCLVALRYARGTVDLPSMSMRGRSTAEDVIAEFTLSEEAE